MNRRRAALAALAAAVFCAAVPMRAQGRAECESMQSRILSHRVGYCVLLPPGYAPKKRKYPVLYFLHGLGGNQFVFVQDGAFNLIEDLWERRKIGGFLIVTPAGDDSFYINSRNGKVRYEDFLTREFFPLIERHYAVEGGRKYRAIAGMSMGGYGALHLAFRHPEMFGSVGTESAALIERLPHIRMGNSSRATRRIFGGAFGSPPSQEFWRRNSPLTLARTFRPAGLKIYFDCGEEDDFGFNRGAEVLDKLLASRRIPHEFHLYPGGHNWVYFARHLPAVLEFESAAFGLKP
jgi:putative tributyrin esterase